MDPSSLKRETVEQLAEEFVERYRRGERPALTEYTERYPEHAGEIRDLFPALVMMEQIAPESDSPASSSPGTTLPQQTREHPKQIGDYRILREIGRGGMGIVYEAEQVSLGRHVALKVLPQQLLPNTKQQQRFEREARAAAKLHHTNIVPVFGVGEEGGVHYYVMQYIPGLGLDAVLDELRRLRREMGPSGSAPVAGELRVARPVGQGSDPVVAVGRIGFPPHKDLSVEEVARSLLTGVFERPDAVAADEAPGEGANSPATSVPPRFESAETALSASSVVLPGQSGEGRQSKRQTYWHSVAHIGVQVARALAYAHQQGILHRDIKPANLLLDTQGTVWVTDFGLAKVEDQQNLTHTGDMVGTLRYMAPEVFNGKADARSEVYALGLTLYEMLALRPAFDEKDHHQLVKQVMTSEPNRLDKLNRVIPRDLVTIVHKAIDREPEHRYQTAHELAEDLHRFLAGEPIRARSAGVWERGVKWARRRPAVAALVAVSAVALLSLLGGTLWHNAQLGTANTELGAALRTSEQRRVEANTNLYNSLIGEVRALRLARVAGYRSLAWERIQQALQLETPEKNRDRLRQEAVACMGDFVGLEPAIWKDFPANISVVALHPRGDQVAIGLSNGTLLFREVATGVEKTQLAAHSSRVHALAFGPDGKVFVSAEENGTIKAWEPDPSGAWNVAKVWKVPRVGDVVGAWRRYIWLAITPDGYLAVCSGGTSNVSMRRLADGTQVTHFTATGVRLSGMAVSANAHLLAAGYSRTDSDLRVVSASTASLLASSLGQGPLLAASALAPPITEERDGILVWDLDTGEVKQRLSSGLERVHAVAFSPDGRFLACAFHSGVAIYETSGFQRLLFRVGDIANSIAISPHRQWVAIASWGLGIVRVLDPLASKEIAILPHPDTPHSVAFSKSGRVLVTADERSVRIWQLPGTNERLILPGHALPAAGLGFSPNGDMLASIGNDRRVIIWNPATGQMIKELPPFRANAYAVAFSPNGRMLAAGDFAGAIRIWQVGSWKELASFERGLGQWVWAVAFSPNGRYFAAASGLGGLTIWSIRDAGSGARAALQEIPGPRGKDVMDVTSFCFSPDSNLLAWVSRGPELFGGHTVHLWDLQKPQARLPGPTSRPARFRNALAFYPDGARLTCINMEEEAEVWDLARNRKAYSFGRGEIGQGAACQVALSADGAWLAVGGGPTVTMWDTETRKLLLKLPDEHGMSSSMAWSPDRELFAVGSDDGKIGIWNIPQIRAQLAEIGLDW